jgi:hypothetical protein
MAGTRDTLIASWVRTLKRLRRNAAELERYGWTGLSEPADVETPPHLRIAVSSTDV